MICLLEVETHTYAAHLRASIYMYAFIHRLLKVVLLYVVQYSLLAWGVCVVHGGRFGRDERCAYNAVILVDTDFNPETFVVALLVDQAVGILVQLLLSFLNNCESRFVFSYRLFSFLCPVLHNLYSYCRSSAVCGQVID